MTTKTAEANDAPASDGIAAKRPAARTRGPRRGRLLVLIALVALGGFYGWRYWQKASATETTDDAFIEGHVVPISARVPGAVLKVLVEDNQEVKKGDLLCVIDPRDYEAKVAQGKAALQTAEERYRTSSAAVALTRVTTGGTLESARSTVQMALSGVERARAGVGIAGANVQAALARRAQAEAQVTTARRTLDQTRAQIPAAQAEAERSASDQRRYRQLYAQDEVTRQQLEHAEVASRTATANLVTARRRADAARAQVTEAEAAVCLADQGIAQARSAMTEAEARVTEAQASVGQAQGQLTTASSAPQQMSVRETEAATASADVVRARAALAEAELYLSYTRIVAPEAGRVTRKAVETGTYVQPGQALMAVVPHDVWVVANFKETQLTDMKVGQKVDVYVDAFPGLPLKGHVESFQAGTGARFALLPPENATGNHVKIVQRLPVKIVFDEPAERLVNLGPGLSVIPEVWIHPR